MAFFPGKLAWLSDSAVSNQFLDSPWNGQDRKASPAQLGILETELGTQHVSVLHGNPFAQAQKRIKTSGRRGPDQLQQLISRVQMANETGQNGN